MGSARIKSVRQRLGLRADIFRKTPSMNPAKDIEKYGKAPLEEAQHSGVYPPKTTGALKPTIPTSMVEGSSVWVGPALSTRGTMQRSTKNKPESELSTKLRVKKRRGKYIHPEGMSTPYNIGAPAKPKYPQVKKQNAWAQKHNIKRFDDPNIAVVSKENAEKYAKSARIQTARQRLADIFDVIEGGGKIKRTEYEDDEEILPRRKSGYGWEDTELMEPEDFLDKAQTIDPSVFRRMHYRKRPWNTGPKTNLSDVHSNFLTDDPKSEYYRGVSNFQWGETHQMDKLEDLEDREIFRGDELGDVEFYKRKIRRGDPIEVPELHHQFNKTIGHEGRHRARALLEEGEEYMPVRGVVVDDAINEDFKGLEYLEGEPTSLDKERPKFRPKYKSPIGLGKSARIQMARERLGAVGKVNWEDILQSYQEAGDGRGRGFLTPKGISYTTSSGLDEYDFETGDTHSDWLHNVLTKHGDKGLLKKYDYDIGKWMKDTGAIRYVNSEENFKLEFEVYKDPTKQQVNFIRNQIEDERNFYSFQREDTDPIEMPEENITIDDYSPNKTLSKELGVEPTEGQTSHVNKLAYGKLRQRIAGLGFRERILNWLKEQPRFKSFDPDSSFVGTVKYDQDNQSMQITLNGKKYDFCNVEERLFDSFSGAGSKGAFFNREIKSLHNCGAW